MLSDEDKEWIAARKAARQAKDEQEKAARDQKLRERRERKERHRQRRVAELNAQLKATTDTVIVPQCREKIKTIRRELSRAQLAEVGRAIEGSKLVRDFCAGCGEAIRVAVVTRTSFCLDCKPTGTPGKRAGKSPETVAMAYHGGRFHAAEW